MKPQPPAENDATGAFQRFEQLAKRLAAVPKAEYDEKRAEYERAKVARREAKSSEDA